MGACGDAAFSAGWRLMQARRSVEARVRNAPLAHAAVVLGTFFHQPLDGVERVGAFVDVLFCRVACPLAGRMSTNSPSDI